MTAADALQKLESRAQLVSLARRWWWLAALVVLALVFAFCRHAPTPLPPKEATTRDSLNATQPDFAARLDSLKNAEAQRRAESAQATARATIAERRADSLHRVAIQAEHRSETAPDSSFALAAARETIGALTLENAALREANDSLHVAIRADSDAIRNADARADEYRRRNAALTDFSDRMAKDLAKADPPCRVALFVKCPTRKQVAIGGAIVGAVATYVVTHPQLIGIR